MSDGVPDACSCAAVRQAARHLTRLYDEALAPTGLSLNQYSILSKLARLGPQSLQSLADLLVMDRSSLGHLLRPLQRRGVLAIGTAGGDKRQRAIELTAAGQALVAEARPLWAGVERRFEREFGLANAVSLRAALRQVTEVGFAPA